MATIGLRDVHYALLITDDVLTKTAEYDNPVRVAGAISANINPNTSSSTLFADDGPYDAAATMGEITLELNLADIPDEVQAVWLGHSYVNGMLIKKSTDTPPWLAIGYRSLKSNGAYRYVWLAKGKFAALEEEYGTKGDSVEFKTPTITGAFVKRDADDVWEIKADSDAKTPNASIATWFQSVPAIPGAPAGDGGDGGEEDPDTTNVADPDAGVPATLEEPQDGDGDDNEATPATTSFF